MNLEFMKIAYEEALKAYDEQEVPIGAVIVHNNKIISRTHNIKNKENSPLYHAEIMCICEAARYLNNWRLDGCDIYITLEPCPMCASLIHQSRIDNVYYAVKKKDKDNYDIISKIFNDNTSNKITKFKYIDCGRKYSNIISDFFKKRR